MLMEKERKEIVEYGKEMSVSGLTKGTAGNISIYDSKTGYMAISPSGIGYNETTPEDVVVMRLDGSVVEGDRKPSSEHDLHSAIYKLKPDMRSVVHTHSTYCVVMSCMNMPLKAVHYVLADAGCFEVPVAPYCTYGTLELAEVVKETIGEGNAVLMANHGMLACGTSLKSAYGLAATCEWTAEIQWRCLAIGQPNVLNNEQMNLVLEKFKGYGQKTKDDNEVKGYFG
ncbi:MAG: class II aldolase/adducin family protein [Coprobacillus sp.]